MNILINYYKLFLRKHLYTKIHCLLSLNFFQTQLLRVFVSKEAYDLIFELNCRRGLYLLRRFLLHLSRCRWSFILVNQWIDEVEKFLCSWSDRIVFEAQSSGQDYMLLLNIKIKCFFLKNEWAMCLNQKGM